MSSDILRSVEEQQLKEDVGVRSDLERLRVGDDVQVHFRIVEGERERIQLVRGTVMRLRKGGGANVSRLNLIRKIRSEPEYLDGKRVVIWCLSARTFTNPKQSWIPVAID